VIDNNFLDSQRTRTEIMVNQDPSDNPEIMRH
jgi:hypothetical protein